jgi:hypothetical protein
MYALKSSGYLFYVSVRCVVKSTLVVHTCEWSYIVVTLHTNSHHVIYDAHQLLSMISEATRQTLELINSHLFKSGRQP